MAQTRSTGLQSEHVRLYCTFQMDGILANPMTQPVVQIVKNEYYLESSSSSTQSVTSESSATDFSTSTGSGSSSSSTEHVRTTGWGPFYAQQEHIGIWYVDWFVPQDAELGDYYDIWTFQWNSNSEVEKLTLKFKVLAGDQFLNFQSKALAQSKSDKVVDMLMGLKNNLIFEVAHIPVYWELGYRGSNTRVNFAFKNWNTDPHPQLRSDVRLLDTGWTPDMDGHVDFAVPLDPEDQVYARYYFDYFSEEEYLSFLSDGLYMMNTVPPASEAYSSIAGMPFAWRSAVTVWASIQALRRLIMGTTMQERQLIWGEDPQRAAEAYERYKGLYTDYMELFAEIKKDVKMRRLPGIAIYVTPEYTLPGGRSRWFRYLYKTG